MKNLILGLSDLKYEFYLGSNKAPNILNSKVPNVHWIKTLKFDSHPIWVVLATVFNYVTGFFYNPIRAIKFCKYSLINNYRFLYRSSSFLRHSWDLIYFPWNSSAIEFEFLFFLNTPSIVSCRGSQINIAPYNPKRINLLKGLQSTLSKASYVHCVCHNILEESLKYCPDRNKFKVIYTGVDTDFFSPLKIHNTSTELIIISVGNQSWKKGFEYALCALKTAMDMGVKFTYHIVGKNSEQERLSYAINFLNLTEHVLLHGQLSKASILKLLRESDIFLLSSLSEGVSNAAVEAMSTGLPVIGFNIGGNEEFIVHQKNGYIVPFRKTDELSKAIHYFWKNSNNLSKLSHEARRTALNQFSLIRHIKEFSTLLDLGIHAK